MVSFAFLDGPIYFVICALQIGRLRQTMSVDANAAVGGIQDYGYANFSDGTERELFTANGIFAANAKRSGW